MKILFSGVGLLLKCNFTATVLVCLVLVQVHSCIDCKSLGKYCIFQTQVGNLGAAMYKYNIYTMYMYACMLLRWPLHTPL